MTTGVFHKVLVPVEFESYEADEARTDEAIEIGDREWVGLGECTVRTLDLADRLARGGEAVLVHATHDCSAYATWRTPRKASELNQDARRHYSEILDAVARRHCPDLELHYVIEPGRPLDVILQAAREHAVEAIVLAASPRGKVNRAFLGSTADKVIRQAGCLVLVVPSGIA